MMDITEDGTSAPSLDPNVSQQQTLSSRMEMMMTADDRMSWGAGSAPSLPSIDDDPRDVSDEDPGDAESYGCG
jgi:hypothetical protein